MALGLLELCSFALIALFLLTQLLIPAVKGTALFPNFRRKRKELIQQLETVNEEQEQQNIKEVLDEKLQTLEEQREAAEKRKAEAVAKKAADSKKKK
jgi:hypothetical protein